jgi:ATP-dependent Lhr-like helicase
MDVMLSGFDPLVAEWFAGRFAQATEPQLRGWPEIRAGRDVLISAPTGSGKTLAAFLIAIDSLVRRARLGPLPDRTEVVYVSPLKALSNDVHKNLEQPLAEILALAAKRGVALAPIRAALRTGDTPQSERQAMTRRGPHILVTTPESLYILLTAAKPREMLAHVGTLIVDEIHAVADDKRGSHLALTLARLDRLVEQNGGAKPQRIGLSATVKPIEEVAAFLVGRTPWSAADALVGMLSLARIGSRGTRADEGVRPTTVAHTSTLDSRVVRVEGLPLAIGEHE